MDPVQAVRPTVAHRIDRSARGGRKVKYRKPRLRLLLAVVAVAIGASLAVGGAFATDPFTTTASTISMCPHASAGGNKSARIRIRQRPRSHYFSVFRRRAGSPPRPVQRSCQVTSFREEESIPTALKLVRWYSQKGLVRRRAGRFSTGPFLSARPVQPMSSFTAVSARRPTSRKPSARTRMSSWTGTTRTSTRVVRER
jgi:hypothetical protein